MCGTVIIDIDDKFVVRLHELRIKRKTTSVHFEAHDGDIYLWLQQVFETKKQNATDASEGSGG